MNARALDEEYDAEFVLEWQGGEHTIIKESMTDEELEAEFDLLLRQLANSQNK